MVLVEVKGEELRELRHELCGVDAGQVVVHVRLIQRRLQQRARHVIARR